MSVKILLVTSCVTIFLFMGCQSIQCPTPSWHNRTITVEGTGGMPATGTYEQKRMMAKRASKIDALKILAQYISKLPVNNDSRASHYIPENWVPGGFTIKSTVFKTDGSCLTTISMPLYKVWDLISRKCRNGK